MRDLVVILYVGAVVSLFIILFVLFGIFSIPVIIMLTAAGVAGWVVEGQKIERERQRNNHNHK